VLVSKPDVLLLDEPTNHLDLPAIEWLEDELKRLEIGAIVLISHDRRFLENLSRATVWIDRGQLRAGSRRASPPSRIGATRCSKRKKSNATSSTARIVRENEWMHGGVTGRRKRNVRRVRELRGPCASEVREQRHGRQCDAGRRRRRQLSGKLVIEAKGIMAKAYGERPIVKDLSIRIMRGDRLGLVGPNGAGKTTLIKLLTGALEPDSGSIRLGTNLELVSLDQRATNSNPIGPSPNALDGRPRRSGRDQRQGAPRRQLHEGFPVPSPNSAARPCACFRAASAAA
jgi:ATP-binding cassette subfamily F protein uup